MFSLLSDCIFPLKHTSEHVSSIFKASWSCPTAFTVKLELFSWAISNSDDLQVPTVALSPASLHHLTLQKPDIRFSQPRMIYYLACLVTPAAPRLDLESASSWKCFTIPQLFTVHLHVLPLLSCCILRICILLNAQYFNFLASFSTGNFLRARVGAPYSSYLLCLLSNRGSDIYWVSGWMDAVSP